MRVILILLVFFQYPSLVNAQILDPTTIGLNRHVCEIPLSKVSNPLSIPYTFKNKASHSRNLDFTINYLANGTIINEGLSSEKTCSTWPQEAKTAFNYAMSIWSDVLENTQNIGVDACWTNDLPSGTGGSAGTNNYYAFSTTGIPFTLYPMALAEHITNSSISTVDINAQFNASFPDWYFGTDAQTPSNKIDFVSVVLHELGHGLGFAGLKFYDDGNGVQECNGIAGHGCIGFDGDLDGKRDPTIYDRFIKGALGNATSEAYANPGLELGNLLNGTGGSLEFDEKELDFYRSSSTLAPGQSIFLPSPYKSGSSYSHFDEAAFANELMSPTIDLGQAIHDPGLSKMALLEMGWSKPSGKTVYVNANKTSGANDGTSWSDAFLDLSDAIDRSNEGDQIWVAEGTYKPTSGKTNNNRDFTFYIDENIKIFGGFPNTGNPTLLDRNPSEHETILSGNLGSIATTIDNAYHVVTFDATTTYGEITEEAVLDGFTIRDGWADAPVYYGGGIYIDALGGNYEATPSISNCFLTNNYADFGGGMFNNGGNGGNASPFVSNTRFFDNIGSGGAVYNAGGGTSGKASPVFTSCVFSYNVTTGFDGGAIVNIGNGVDSECIPEFTNCIFAYNSTVGDGEHFYNVAAFPIITNCTFLTSPTEGGAIYESLNAVSEINNSVFFGNSSVGNATVVLTNNIIQESENIANPLFQDANNLNGLDGIFGTSDDGIMLSTNSPAINMGTITGAPTVDILGSSRNGLPDLGAFEVACQGQKVYVNNLASGSQSGLNWTNAFTTIQDAQDFASNCSTVEEIWVAAGTYYPHEDVLGNTAPTDNRTKSFNFSEGIKIYGGFAGIENDISQRNISEYPTIFSGDFNADDEITGTDETLTISNNNENAYHIISILNPSLILDGITISGGNANGSNDASKGGGIWNNGGSAVLIENCNFHGNSATNGGGLHNTNSGIQIMNCTFDNNLANDGGAIYNTNSDITLVNSFLQNNKSNLSGGGIFNDQSSPVISNTVFLANLANQGGGIANIQSAPIITNGLFIDNKAIVRGGGIHNITNSEPELMNTAFFKNVAPSNKSLYNDGSSALSSQSTHNASDSETSTISSVGRGFVDISSTTYEALFVGHTNINGFDRFPATKDDGLHLTSASVLLGAGNGIAMIYEDIAGSFRPFTPSIGPYESYPCGNPVLWTGNTSGDWHSSANNWSTGFFPQECDEVYISANSTVNIGPGQLIKCQKLVLQQNSVLHVDASSQIIAEEYITAPNCNDGIQNGSETAIDCGGPDCLPCPTCSDGILNGNETEIDCGGPDCSPCPTFTDSRDGKIYSIIEIGTQAWFGENLDYQSAGARCYRGNTSNCDTYGKLYTWYEAQNVCPAGSHLPSDTEWEFLKGSVSNDGGALKEAGLVHWNEPNEGANNSTGFTALPGGAKAFNAGYFGLGNNGYWWTLDEQDNDNAWSNTLWWDITDIDRSSSNKGNYLSVRCVLDSANPTCSDGVKNGNETGQDCGGPDCTPCAGCDDGILNGEEEDVDCGGPSCAPCYTCDDGIQNGMEQGVDCGGDCFTPCWTCTDGIQNGGETGVDCGGPECKPCIGDAYQGGIFFYEFKPGDYGYVSGEFHGLIAAASDEPNPYFGGFTMVFDYDSGCGPTPNFPGVGWGEINTIAILALCGAENSLIGAKATSRCGKKTVLDSGILYDDWFLPSKGELGIMYANRTAIGGFNNDIYWSSTENFDPEISDAYMWAQYFSSGAPKLTFKYDSAAVRAIRKF